jgi:hypothetical protein
MKIKLAISALVVGALAAGAVAATTTTQPLTGKIGLVGTVTEYTQIEDFPLPRETWYFSLNSIRRPGRLFGYGVMACTYISTQNTLRQCSGTFSLPRGKIVVAGSFIKARNFQLALTGGIEAYVGVGGTVRFSQFPKRHSNYWITFSLQ